MYIPNNNAIHGIGCISFLRILFHLWSNGGWKSTKVLMLEMVTTRLHQKCGKRLGGRLQMRSETFQLPSLGNFLTLSLIDLPILPKPGVSCSCIWPLSCFKTYFLIKPPAPLRPDWYHEDVFVDWNHIWGGQQFGTKNLCMGTSIWRVSISHHCYYKKLTTVASKVLLSISSIPSTCLHHSCAWSPPCSCQHPILRASLGIVDISHGTDVWWLPAQSWI